MNSWLRRESAGHEHLARRAANPALVARRGERDRREPRALADFASRRRAPHRQAHHRHVRQPQLRTAGERARRGRRLALLARRPGHPRRCPRRHRGSVQPARPPREVAQRHQGRRGQLDTHVAAPIPRVAVLAGLGRRARRDRRAPIGVFERIDAGALLWQFWRAAAGVRGAAHQGRSLARERQRRVAPLGRFRRGAETLPLGQGWDAARRRVRGCSSERRRRAATTILGCAGAAHRCRSCLGTAWRRRRRRAACWSSRRATSRSRRLAIRPSSCDRCGSTWDKSRQGSATSCGRSRAI